jgi:hypothetical protein
MKLSGAFSLALAALLFGPSPVSAQHAARFVGASPAASGRRTSSVFRVTPVRTGRRNGLVSNNGTFNSGFGLTNIYPGTGLGINGINTILTQSNLGVEAAIDPATQWNLALAERLLKIGSGTFPGGGYYFLSGGGAYPVPSESVEGEQPVQQQPQPQVIVLQQAPAQQPPTQLAQEPVAPPLPDIGQFTLILQDGRQIQAVAFTQMNGRIIYISNEGGRRTIALSDLDKSATVRVNEERGTPLQLPL